MKIGLFFGSFNPVHTGHLLIADYFIEFGGLDKIWFVVSPQNPFKINDKLADEKDRLKMMKLAIEKNEKFEACDIEFALERPSYTVNTLSHLKNKFPEHTFYLIIGGDNLQSFHLWKNYREIVENYEILVYRRTGFHDNPLLANHPHIRTYDVPLLNISSTYIREIIQANKSIKYLVPEKVQQYIEDNCLYK